MDREKLIRVGQEELEKHDFSTFVSNPPAIALGGRGVVVSGCPGCKKQMQSLNQFMRHLAEDVLPVIADRALGGREPGED
jgi:hypothetical protein